MRLRLAILLGILVAAAACGDDCQAAKAEFLARWSDHYGFGGRIDELWSKARWGVGMHVARRRPPPLLCRLFLPVRGPDGLEGPGALHSAPYPAAAGC